MQAVKYGNMFCVPWKVEWFSSNIWLSRTVNGTYDFCGLCHFTPFTCIANTIFFLEARVRRKCIVAQKAVNRLVNFIIKCAVNFVFLAEFTITVRNETLNFYSTTENPDDILQIRCHNLVNGIPVTTRERFRLTDLWTICTHKTPNFTCFPGQLWRADSYGPWHGKRAIVAEWGRCKTTGVRRN